ncbi:Chromosome-associated kinesin KIF4A [Cytospora mali]|uniref:Chromosome-associated kinesin KIF4A n=1 Tax=Cytospora mali TaxID=578113 RepID=A0A194WBE5_CYTMA|nr:Chromosome-associated kinesin KIF4A [Valsa mali]
MPSPPSSPGTLPQRPMSAMIRPTQRSSSRMSTSSKVGGSRASDEDVRTSVKVAVRVRPPLNPTDPGFDLIPQRFQRSMVQVMSNTTLAIDAPQGRKVFVFDRVFSPDVEQEGLWDYLEDCVNAFTTGYNVSLLAYGQSGAGKSYTMGTSGPQDDLAVMGVIPRAAIALFEKLDGPKGNPNRNSMSQIRAPARYSTQAPARKGEKDWVLKATYVEIYNEQLRDLLLPEHIPAHERSPVTIREDTKGNILLTGLRQIEIHSVEDLLNALNFGSNVRQTDATAINARSSRSHAVFSLNLVQKKFGFSGGHDKRHSVPVEAMTGAESWTTTDSKMHFVDLAGSERLKNTHAEGARAKEGISINAGLAALGKVISQLSSRNAGAHVSYRDSKLTRLLQDSLGGNAITYMIACVTPAEFHLSETLNTVQYAQRARAIQSKPRIQQVEEGDKQALIDRLKAEVAFLREQIRSSDRGGGGDRRILPSSERSERQNEREAELQNHLLDVQENYSTLSQRHAKLIAEMAKARDMEAAENSQHEENLGDSATERLNRSNNFAQAVEQVVLEYEKTIQALEQSLSSTRSTLHACETSLLEKESKVAYAETINSQLQGRLQKLLDREATTETYLHDLEAKLNGHNSGEEKNATIITELRKEIARIRENEAGCEDYISTLEERLAEADQDAELMQREIDRLEQVIERQRSLGKLDSLLYELDHIQKDTNIPEPEAVSNGASHRRSISRGFADHSRNQSHNGRQLEEAIPESHEEEEGDISVIAEEGHDSEETSQSKSVPEAEQQLEYPTSPAQSKFVQDKLENVTQELIDLRVEHEGTLNQYDLLHAKYDEALRTLAELQDTIDEARHPHRVRDSILSATSPSEDQTRPSSFLSEPRSGQLKDGESPLLSRSLSSELSSAMDSPVVMETSDTETAKSKSDEYAPEVLQEHPSTVEAGGLADDEAGGSDLTAQLERFRSLAATKEAAERELTKKYAELEKQHHEALDVVEELKTEVAKARHGFEPPSPRTASHVIRRKSSQNVMIIDRAHRSFASLRNIAAENFEEEPEIMQNFELNLNAAMHELHARSERIQELEADVANAKKEMEAKMQIISGLTRERSSLKTSPKDVSLISTLKDQLEKNERQLHEMQGAHAAREQELQAELASLRASMETSKPEETKEIPEEETEEVSEEVVKEVPEDETKEVSDITDEQRAAHEQRIAQLEADLADWETKHKSAQDTMQATEQQMRTTIEELETQLATVNAQLKESSQSTEEGAEAKEAEEKTEDLMSTLRSELDEYKAIISSNTTKVAELEQAHEAAKNELEEAHKARDLAIAESEQHKQQLESQLGELESVRQEAEQNRQEAEAHKHDAETHRELASILENQISSHEQVIKTHQRSMELLRTTHAKEIEDLHNSTKQDAEARIEALKAENAKHTKKLESALTEAREDLMKVATQVAFALGMDVSVELISQRIEDLIADQKAFGEQQKKTVELEKAVHEISNVNDSLMQDLETVKSTLSDILMENGAELKSPYPSVVEQATVVKRKMVDLQSKNKKNSRLVDELEEQLQNNFDQVQMTNNRLSTLHERNAQLEDALNAKSRLQQELDALREQYAALQVKMNSGTNGDTIGRSDSLNGQVVRKNASISSLPSPPPAIPLPPLPSNSSGTTSPTPGMRPPSKDMMQQIQEDQEVRIRTIEKHLAAEKQLTSTLEEALTDLERQSNKVKTDCDAWRRRCTELETELKALKNKPPQDQRWSLQQVEEERKKREAAERARAHLEERMNALNKKKKKGSLNCF